VLSKLDIQLSDENSRPLLNFPAYIEVASVEGGSPRRGYTDSNGRVSFDVPSSTTYQLTASGPGIESKSVTFAIPPSQRFHHEEIRVKPHTEGTATNAPGGMVSAANLRVPEKAGHEFAKGMKEMNAHNWSKAREHLEKAIKYYPQFDWAYNNMGVAYVQEKNTKAAREAFEKAVAINDKNPDAVRNLARMKLMDNDFSGGKELLLKLGPNPRDLDALMMLAYAQLKTHELDAALANALQVHQGDQDHFPLAHLVAARVYEVKGNQSAAQSQYQMYLKEAPDSPEARIAKEGLQRLAASQ
jgi:tetratricopeptide (TPR) repeat protein